MAESDSPPEELDSLREYFNRSEIQDEYVALKDSSGVQEISPHNVLRERQLLRVLEQYVSEKSVLFECGTGLGGLVLELLQRSYDPYGIDISSEMVAKAQSRLKESEADPERIQCADLYDYSTTKTFDAAIANGVICYYRDHDKFLTAFGKHIKKDGHIFVTHRNLLFNLFALNKGTIEFFRDHLLPKDSQEEFEREVEKQHPTLLSDIKKGSNADLYRSAENPLDVEALYARNGFAVVETQGTYIHHQLPSIPSKNNFKELQDLYENTAKDWRSLFLGSQFLVVARKVG